MKGTLIERLLEAGYPADEIYHHESDLYVYKTEATTKVLDEWLEDNGWRKLANDPFLVSVFKDQITGKPMYDIAFQYYNFKEAE